MLALHDYRVTACVIAGDGPQGEHIAKLVGDAARAAAITCVVRQRPWPPEISETFCTLAVQAGPTLLIKFESYSGLIHRLWLLLLLERSWLSVWIAQSEQSWVACVAGCVSWLPIRYGTANTCLPMRPCQLWPSWQHLAALSLRGVWQSWRPHPSSSP